MNRLTVSLVIVLVLSVLTSLTVIVLQQRSISRLQAENVQLRQNTTAPTTIATALRGVRESDIPGRYHWIDNGVETSIVELFADHAVTANSSQKNARFRWILQPQGLVVLWQNSYTLFTESTAPGSYTGSNQRTSTQMIKVE